MGTYSGYAEFYLGYALTVEINIGAYSEPDEEFEELQREQAAMRGALASVGERLGEVVAHYAESGHPFRRYVHLLDRATRDELTGPAPEPFWSSERRSRGFKLPLALFKDPEPAPVDRPLTVRGSPLRPTDPVVLTLYLASDRVPYLVREVIDGHCVVSQFAPGGLLADADAGCSPDELIGVLEDAHRGVNRHTLYRLLRAASAVRPLVGEIASGSAKASDSARLIAEVVNVFLDPSSFDPALVPRARQNRQALTLLATLTSDDHWSAHGDALHALDEAFREVEFPK